MTLLSSLSNYRCQRKRINMTTTNVQPPCLITIFGATGDLTKRKLLPSLFHLFQQNNLNEKFAIVGIGRRDWSNDDFRALAKASITAHITNTQLLDEFLSHIYFSPLDVTEEAHFANLKSLHNELDTTYQLEGNRLFYLAMGPEFFGPVAKQLKKHKLTDTVGFHRLIIEKPFGRDLKSASVLNKEISQSFKEQDIYRIDHYLGKDMVQNITVLRFANMLFEPLWNNQYIANVQITSSEQLGVEERGGYYETSGALRDMMQNHMLQMVALLAMEPPISLSPEDIRNEKVKALRSINIYSEQEVKENIVRGQYGSGQNQVAYRDEARVDKNSNTETFVGAKIMLDNFRWKGVPFYVRTGKRMKEKEITIVVEFKEVPMNLFYQREKKTPSNILVIRIQPDEGITLYVNAKRGTHGIDTRPIPLSYSLTTADKMNTVDAYESLIYDALRGDATNFTHWEELKASWMFIDKIANAWQNETPQFPNYPAGSDGPKDFTELLKKDGFEWWEV